MSKRVLVHDCIRPEWDDGSPLQCDCNHRVTPGEASAMVDAGRGAWRRKADGVGEIHSEILRAGRLPLHAETITRRHILRAMVDEETLTEKPAYDRIEIYPTVH